MHTHTHIHLHTSMGFCMHTTLSPRECEHVLFVVQRFLYVCKREKKEKALPFGSDIFLLLTFSLNLTIFATWSTFVKNLFPFSFSFIYKRDFLFTIELAFWLICFGALFLLSVIHVENIGHFERLVIYDSLIFSLQPPPPLCVAII